MLKQAEKEKMKENAGKSRAKKPVEVIDSNACSSLLVGKNIVNTRIFFEMGVQGVTDGTMLNVQMWKERKQKKMLKIWGTSSVTSVCDVLLVIVTYIDLDIKQIL